MEINDRHKRSNGDRGVERQPETVAIERLQGKRFVNKGSAAEPRTGEGWTTGGREPKKTEEKLSPAIKAQDLFTGAESAEICATIR